MEPVVATVASGLSAVSSVMKIAESYRAPKGKDPMMNIHLVNPVIEVHFHQPCVLVTPQPAPELNAQPASVQLDDELRLQIAIWVAIVLGGIVGWCITMAILTKP